MNQAATELMKGYDKDGCSFVIRIWREKNDTTEAEGELRGWIAHVQSGRRAFFRDTAVIGSFIDDCITSESRN